MPAKAIQDQTLTDREEKAGVLWKIGLVPSNERLYVYPTAREPSDPDYPRANQNFQTSEIRYVNQADGDDANDGILVADGGTGAWASIPYAYEQYCNNQNGIREIRLQGNYSATSSFNSKFWGAGTGTIDSFSCFRGVAFGPTVKPTITFASDVRFNIMNQSFMTWVDFDMHVVDGAGIHLGQDNPTRNHTFRNVIGTGSGLGGDNVGFVVMKNSNCDKIGVFNCDLVASSEAGVHGNTSAIILFGVDRFKIENNRLSGGARSFYFKHSNSGDAETAGWSFRKNFITNSRDGSQIAGRHGVIEDNIFDSDLYFGNFGGGLPQRDCVVNHNTFTGRLLLSRRDAPVQNNLVTNNIIDLLRIYEYGDDSNPDHFNTTNQFDYNLYTSQAANKIKTRRVDFATLADWQANSEPANQDVNSLEGQPVYINNALTEPSHYKLSTISVGYSEASDNKDIGAKTASVGVQIG